MYDFVQCAHKCASEKKKECPSTRHTPWCINTIPLVIFTAYCGTLRVEMGETKPLEVRRTALVGLRWEGICLITLEIFLRPLLVWMVNPPNIWGWWCRGAHNLGPLVCTVRSALPDADALSGRRCCWPVFLLTNWKELADDFRRSVAVIGRKKFSSLEDMERCNGERAGLSKPSQSTSRVLELIGEFSTIWTASSSTRWSNIFKQSSPKLTLRDMLGSVWRVSEEGEGGRWRARLKKVLFWVRCLFNRLYSDGGRREKWTYSLSWYSGGRATW